MIATRCFWIPALCAASLQVQAEDITPGLWKISLESSVQASPDWNPEPFELSQCLTENEARHPEQLLLGMGSQGVTGCTFSNQQASGGHLSFDVNCAGTLGIRGHGDVRYTPTTLDGVLDVNLGEAEKISMRNQLHASYLGGCGGAQADAAPAFRQESDPNPGLEEEEAVEPPAE